MGQDKGRKGDKTLEASLEILFVGNPDFDEISKARNVFCPFEAIGMVRQEIRHAHFLHYCLDPRRPHGFGDAVLRSFMRAAAIAQHKREERVQNSVLTPVGVHVMDLGSAEILREWRRIDLVVVIEKEKVVVAIELKIDAREHSNQLGRYQKTINEHWPERDGWHHLLLFLTKEGEDSSDGNNRWISLGLRDLADEFQTVIERQLGIPEARSLLSSYLSMIRRNIVTNEKLVELASKLWKQHGDALDFLMEHRPNDSLSGLLQERQAEICRALSENTGLHVVPDFNTQNHIRFAVSEWDQLPDFCATSGWTKSKRLFLYGSYRSLGQ